MGMGLLLYGETNRRDNPLEKAPLLGYPGHKHHANQPMKWGSSPSPRLGPGWARRQHSTQGRAEVLWSARGVQFPAQRKS